MAPGKLAILYALFAAVSTGANIAAQESFLRIYSGKFQILASVMVGTLLGLVVKYVLDKRYIFRVQTTDSLRDGRLFSLYALTGIFTTALFWGFEFSFHFVFESKVMRYFGGVLGLALGYLIKYRLDKRFVFVAGRW